MFYAHIVLAKKGPFARIWLAAHWDKKLTKAHVFETDIEQSVEGIMQPKVKLALRTSGHLLLGVVRIYSRKAKYLLADCNEAFVKIKMAFRPGMVDLPEEHREAAVNAITLPEVFHDFDTALPELNDVDIEAQFSINQSRADEITMREDYGSIPMSIHDEGFGDMAMDDIDFTHADPNVIDDPNLMDELVGPGGSVSLGVDHHHGAAGTSRSLLGGGLDDHMGNDGFGDTIGTDGFGDAGPANGLFEGDLFGDATLGDEPMPPLLAGGKSGKAGEAGPSGGGAVGAGARAAADSDSDDDDAELGGGGGGWADDAGGASSTASSPIEFMAASPPAARGLHTANAGVGLDADDRDAASATAAAMRKEDGAADNDENDPNALNGQLGLGGAEAEAGSLGAGGAATPADGADADDGAAGDHHHHHHQATLLHNEEESFALAPVDASALKGVTKAKRKRKLIVDEVKNISGEEMKSQLANTSDIITTLDLAPPTKRLMYWKDTGGVEKVFTLCSRDIKARVLFRNNQRHFLLRTHHLDDFAQLGPSDVLALDQYQHDAEVAAAALAAAAAGQKRGRKRKLAAALESPTAAAVAVLPVEPHPLSGADQSVARATMDGIEHSIQSLAGALDPSMAADISALPLHATLNDPAAAGAAEKSAREPNEDELSLHRNLSNEPLPFDLHSLPPVGNQSERDASYMDDGGAPDMTPGYSADYGGAADIQSPAYAPSYDGGATPQYPLVDAIPNLPADQVQSILNEASGVTGAGPTAAERVANDWSGTESSSFDFPQEVATHQPGDEQLENETDEQFEERVLNKRAAQMFVSVRARMQTVDHMYLSEMTHRNNRKQAAQKFYSLLVLKKFRALDIQQDASYGDILVTKGTMFDNPKL